MEEDTADATPHTETSSSHSRPETHRLPVKILDTLVESTQESRSFLQQLALEASKATSPAAMSLHSTSPPSEITDPQIADVTIGKKVETKSPVGLNGTTPEDEHAIYTMLAAGQNNSNEVDDARQRATVTPDYEDSQAYASSSPPSPLHSTPIKNIPNLEDTLSVIEPEAPRIQAFAKLEFDDGQFYMNTYSVELGRDIRACRMAYQKNIEANQEAEAKTKSQSTSSGDFAHTPKKVKRKGGREIASSLVSESGGIMGVDPEEHVPRRRTKAMKSKSTSSSSQHLSRKGSTLLPPSQTDYQSLAMASLMDYSFGAHPVDPLSLLPSPDECPLIPIHPPTVPVGAPTGHKGISRKHVKIGFNFEKHLFEVEINGMNGAFVDEQWHPEGDVIPLKSGSLIQIGGVGVRFVLPDVALGETGAEGTMTSDPASGGKMSFEFEAGRGENIAMADSSEDNSSSDVDTNHEDEDGEDDDSENEAEDEQGEEEQSEDEPEIVEEVKVVKKAAKKVMEPVPKLEPPVLPPKRKGPGRPPKNGIISKREQALLARQAREAAKAAAQKNPSTQLAPGKGKSGKPRSDANQETPPPEPKREKRKYKQRKKAGVQPEAENIRQSTEKTESVPPDQILRASLPPKPPKAKKPPKPPRSPSPVFDEATLTPEQLAKPQSSYVILIHEALSNSPTGAMSLPQIYRAIERRYPFYKLRVQTTGWQSSVRHNLSQHPAFQKIERDGKGWMWGLEPEVSIEKENKKKRSTPPPIPPQQYYQPGPDPSQNPYHYPGMPLPDGHMPGPPVYPPYAMHPGMPQAHGPNGQLYHPAPFGPNGFPLPLPLANAQVDTSSTYQSPYQPAPQAQPPAVISPPQPPTSLQNGVNPVHNTMTSQPPLPPPPSSSNPMLQTTRPSPSPAPYQPQPQGLLQQQQLLQQPSPQRPQNHISPDVLQAVSKFKTALITSMPDNAHAEAIVTSAINRTLGNQTASSVPNHEEDPQEKAVMQALAGLLEDLNKKSQEAHRQASNPPQQHQYPPQSHLPAQVLSPQLQHQQQHQNTPNPMPPPSSQTQQNAQAQLIQILNQISRRPNGTPTQPHPSKQPSPITSPLHLATAHSTMTDLPSPGSAATNTAGKATNRVVLPVTGGVKRSFEEDAEGGVEQGGKKVAVG
ncbi:hypothetical protein MMC12_008017 [Toensbergia leucococca]|nr:hypothetical protein [Toensbergia leucococca]